MDGGQVRGYSSAAVCSRLFKLWMFVMIQPGLTVISKATTEKTSWAPKERNQDGLFKSINTYLDFVEKLLW